MSKTLQTKSTNMKFRFKSASLLSLVLVFLLTSLGLNAQTLEFFSGSASLGQGPTADAQTATLRLNTNNPSGNTNQAYTTPPVSVTLSISNQQYLPAGYSGKNYPGLLIGASNGTPNNPVAQDIFRLLNANASPLNAHFTSDRLGSSGTGISVSSNYGFYMATDANYMYHDNEPLDARMYYANITYTFSQPVNNPVIHFSGLGGAIETSGSAIQGFYTELELINSNLSLSKLSGNGNFNVTNDNKILNSNTANSTASERYASNQYFAGAGSVVVNTANSGPITSVTFRVYLKGNGGYNGKTNWMVTGNGALDAWITTVTLLPGDIDPFTYNLSGNLFNDINGLVDGTVNGTGTNLNGTIKAVLVDANDKVVAITPIASNGTYSFTDILQGSYTVLITTENPSVGANAPTVKLPAGWKHTGENIGTGVGNDNLADGKINIIIANANVTEANFGVQESNINQYLDCSGILSCTDPTNSGVASHSAASLSYDNIISAWHASATNTSADGTISVWGQNSSATGGDHLSPTVVNQLNGYSYTGLPVKVAMASRIDQSGSNFSYPHQYILLTNDNALWTWGGGGAVLSTSLASGNTFKKVTPGNSGANSSLPAGVSASDVKMMFATTGTLAITTCEDEVWVLSQNAQIRQNGSATSWVQIHKSNSANGSTDNGVLTNIVATRGTPAGLIALDANGDLWTWGYNTYLGNSTSKANRLYATKMTLPKSGAIKMIGATTQRNSYSSYDLTYTSGGMITTQGISYYVLYEDGNLYSLGMNTGRQLGDWTTTERTSWVQPKYNSTSGPVMNNIAWISPQEHDFMFGFINMITKDSILYNWGDESGDDLGRSNPAQGTGSVVTYAPRNPGTPNLWETGSNSEILTVESGGHTTMMLRKCSNTFGYIGHRTNGSMGDDNGDQETDNEVKFNTNAIEVCGIPTINAKLELSLSSNGNNFCKNNPIEFVGTPTGGTYSIDGNAYGATINSTTGVLNANSMNFGIDTTKTLRIKYRLPAGAECAGSDVQAVVTIEDCISSTINIPGSIWNDDNANATKENGETNISTNPYWANLVSPSGQVIGFAKVNPDGTYNIQVLNDAIENVGDYQVIITDSKKIIGANLSQGSTLTDNKVYSGTNRGNNNNSNTSNTSGVLNIGDLSVFSNSLVNVTIDSANYGIATSKLQITKTSNVINGYIEGDTITYTIVIKNNDNSIHNDVKLTDALPNGVTYVAGSTTAVLGNNQLPSEGAPVTQTYNTGSGSFSVPNGVSSLRVQTWGAGGKGGTRSTNGNGGGAGGGAYSESTITVSQSSYNYSVGTGATGTSAGGDSWFSPSNVSNAVVLAKGGNSVANNSNAGASGGAASSGIGSIRYSGGNGSSVTSGSGGGGGGSSAGTSLKGYDGVFNTGASAPIGGGDGGDGGASNAAGQPGLSPGGGGGGAHRSGSGTRNGGSGADGQVIISYNSITYQTIQGTVGAPSVLADNWSILPGDSLTVTYKTVVKSPVTDSIYNRAAVTTHIVKDSIIDDVTDYIKENTTNAVNDENSTWVNVPVGGDVTTNDFDLEGNNQDFGTFLNQNGSGTPISSGATVKGKDQNGNPVNNAGTLTFDGDGNYIYTPSNNFVGTIEVPYSICDDGYPEACDTAVLVITVTPLNTDANSVIANNDEYHTKGSPVTSDITTNDADPQGDDYEVTKLWIDTDGDGIPETVANLGQEYTVGGVNEDGTPTNNAGKLTQNADGTFTFEPTDGFKGRVFYDYRITDDYTSAPASDDAKVVITVVRDGSNDGRGPKNDPPVAGDDFTYTTVNTPKGGCFICNDYDMNDDPISYNGVTIDPNGPATPIDTLTTVEGGLIVINKDGTYIYYPPTDYIGPDRVEYEICDVTVIEPQPLCTKATIHTLIGIENTTNAVNDENSTWVNTPVGGDVTINDFDLEGNNQDFGTFLNQNGNGTPISSGATVSGKDKNGNPVNNAGTLTFDGNGNYIYTPYNNFVGTIEVPYSICDDGRPVACDTAVLIITVSALPTDANSVIANNDEYHSKGETINGDITTNDADPQGDDFEVTKLWIDTDGDGIPETVANLGQEYTVGGVNEDGTPTNNAGKLTQNADGTFTFEPTDGFKGRVFYDYRITDDYTADPASDDAKVVITIVNPLSPNNRGPKNDPPVAGDDFTYTTVNTPKGGCFICNDYDMNDDPISYNGVTIDPNGPATPLDTLTTEQGGQVVINKDGTYTYYPPTDYIGPDQVEYEICDVTVIEPQPLCAKATIHTLIGPGLTIEGNLFHDGNGMTDNYVNGPGTNVTNKVYAVLTDTSGNVLQSVPVNPDGTYEFTNVPFQTNLRVLIDTLQRNKGDNVTVSAVPQGWVSTGEIIGQINAIPGNDGNTNGQSSQVQKPRTHVADINFAIQQLPNADDKLYNTPTSAFEQRDNTDPLYPNEFVSSGTKFFVLSTDNTYLTGYPDNNNVDMGGRLTGRDPEDCAVNMTCNSGSPFIIDSIYPSTVLYYDFGNENGIVRINKGDTIPNYDPSKLIIAAREGSGMEDDPIGFHYSLVDEAGFASAPASYTIRTEAALPVELLYFTADVKDCSVVLNWATASELNNDYFEVQRSVDARSWEVLSQVIGHGTTNNRHEYNYVDGSALSGTVYYRLRQVDYDGVSEIFKVVSVQAPSCGSNRVVLYPNPTHHVLNVKIDYSNLNDLDIKIYDSKGGLVRHLKEVLSDNQIDVHYLPNGTYLLQLTSPSEQIGVYPFIISK